MIELFKSWRQQIQKPIEERYGKILKQYAKELERASVTFLYLVEDYGGGAVTERPLDRQKLMRQEKPISFNNKV